MFDIIKDFYEIISFIDLIYLSITVLSLMKKAIPWVKSLFMRVIQVMKLFLSEQTGQIETVILNYYLEPMRSDFPNKTQVR